MAKLERKTLNYFLPILTWVILCFLRENKVSSSEFKENKRRTSKVGAISEAQKAQSF